MNRGRLLVALSYLTVYLVWGSTYFFIKLSVETIPPFYVVGLRFIVGGILVLSLSYLSGSLRSWPTWRQIGSALFLGTFLLLIGSGLLTVAEQEVDSYLASLIVAATPIAVALYDRFLIGKVISGARLLGTFVGIAGVALLLYDGRSISSSLTPEVLMVIGGVASWGFATSMGHRMKGHPDSMVNSGLQMLFVGIVCLIWASLFYPPLPRVLASASPRSLLGVAYLAIVGSLAFAAFNYLIAHEPAGRVVSYALINPLIAVLLGLLLGQESPAPLLPLGLPLILSGLFLMLYGEPALAYLRKRSASAKPLAER